MGLSYYLCCVVAKPRMDHMSSFISSIFLLLGVCNGQKISSLLEGGVANWNEWKYGGGLAENGRVLPPPGYCNGVLWYCSLFQQSAIGFLANSAQWAKDQLAIIARPANYTMVSMWCLLLVAACCSSRTITEPPVASPLLSSVNYSYSLLLASSDVRNKL